MEAVKRLEAAKKRLSKENNEKQTILRDTSYKGNGQKVAKGLKWNEAY